MADGDPSGEGGLILLGDPETPDTQSSAGSEGTKEPAVTDGSTEDGKRPGWMDQLDGDLKDNEALRKYKSASELAKGHIELEGKLGKSIVVPGDDATKEERSRFYSRLGRPEKPDGYDLSDAEMPKGMKLTKDTEKLTKDVSFRLGLNNGQAKGIAEAIAGRDAAVLTTAVRATKQSLEKGITALKEEWGDGFDEKTALAHRAIEKHFGKNFMGVLQRSGMENYPALLKGAASIGEATAESASPRGVAPDGGAKKPMFPAAAKAVADRRKGRAGS